MDEGNKMWFESVAQAKKDTVNKLKDIKIIGTSGYKPLIIMDITCMPKEYQEIETLTEAVKKYEEDFGVKIIPIDTSRQNLQGTDNPRVIVVR